MAKISVIVPIYGVEKFLREAVDSILNQTMTDLEVILIDDGSKDGCPQIIDEYAAKDKRVIAIHKSNGGYGQSMNVGLSRATGEYIAILEPDDYIDSKMYEDLYKIAKQYNSDIVKSCFYDNLKIKNKYLTKKQKWEDYIPEDRSFTIKEYPYFLYYHPSIWSCIYKKEFLDKHKIRFVEAPGAGWTDNPFQVQTLILAERINFTNKAYYYWRKLQPNDSCDLKDYKIPFQRTDEIHEWLESKNINDTNNIDLLIHLYRRELAYMQIVLGMKKFSDKEDVYNRIKKVLSHIPAEYFMNNKDVRNDEKAAFELITKRLWYARFKYRLKSIRKYILSIRLNKKEGRIIILGNHWQFWKNEV